MKKHHQYRTGLLTIYQGCLVCPWFSFLLCDFLSGEWRHITFSRFVYITTWQWVIYPFVNCCNFWGDWKRKVTRSFLELQSRVWSRSWRFCIPIARKKSSSAEEKAKSIFNQPRFFVKKNPFDKKGNPFFFVLKNNFLGVHWNSLLWRMIYKFHSDHISCWAFKQVGGFNHWARAYYWSQIFHVLSKEICEKVFQGTKRWLVHKLQQIVGSIERRHIPFFLERCILQFSCGFFQRVTRHLQPFWGGLIVGSVEP